MGVKPGAEAWSLRLAAAGVGWNGGERMAGWGDRLAGAVGAKPGVWNLFCGMETCLNT